MTHGSVMGMIVSCQKIGRNEAATKHSLGATILRRIREITSPTHASLPRLQPARTGWVCPEIGSRSLMSGRSSPTFEIGKNSVKANTAKLAGLTSRAEFQVCSLLG
jgi:hypothetical protein